MPKNNYLLLFLCLVLIFVFSNLCIEYDTNSKNTKKINSLEYELKHQDTLIKKYESVVDAFDDFPDEKVRKQTDSVFAKYFYNR